MRMSRGGVVAGLLAILVVGAPAAGAPAAAAPAGTIAVTGAVAFPRTYTAADIAALPQLTVADPHGRRVTGAPLEDIVTDAAPLLPSGKNTQLRVTVTVTDTRGRAVTFALGELDPAFGNHTALLATNRRQPRQVNEVVPQDTGWQRSIGHVVTIAVGVSAAEVAPAPAGGVTIDLPDATTALTAAQLAALPQHTLTVEFLAGTASQTHTERGPTLADVLQAAGVEPTSTTAVVAVGSDGYAAAVTPAEATVGGRPLLLSLSEDDVPLSQPRLVPDGDVKGGRYVSDVVVLAVSD
jgi:hypothetical protein